MGYLYTFASQLFFTLLESTWVTWVTNSLESFKITFHFPRWIANTAYQHVNEQEFEVLFHDLDSSTGNKNKILAWAINDF